MTDRARAQHVILRCDDEAMVALALGYVDNMLSIDQLDDLRRRLTSSAEARNVFVALCVQSHQMADVSAPVEVLPGETVEIPPVVRPIASHRHWAGWAAAMAIAAAIVLMFMLAPVSPHAARHPSTALTDQPAGPFVATLTNAVDAVYESADASIPLGEQLAERPIRLRSGSVQLMYGSTAVVDLVGPCEFEMTGPNRGRLTRGRLEAYVPDRAHGFAVDLPGGARVIDLGTRFTIDATAAERAFVVVHEGKVDVIGPEATVSGAEPVRMRLVAGQSAQCDLRTGLPTIAALPAVPADLDHTHPWLIQHSGAADPRTEGWISTSNLDAGLVAPVTDDPAGPAWLVYDNNRRNDANRGSMPSRPSYRMDLPKAMHGSVMEQAWVLEAVVSVDADGASPPNGSRVINFVGPDTRDDPDGGREFWLDLGATPDDRLIVDSRNDHASFVSDHAGYHRLRLVYDPASRTAALYIDGSLTPVYRDDPGSVKPTRGDLAGCFVRFGSTSTPDTGAARYRFVGFALLGANPTGKHN
ncbi:MAG: hypothetical protein GC162_06880 [Planctomycetes bacterium]|nr:hypothetical protein [Planctomycetota bacterium]